MYGGMGGAWNCGSFLAFTHFLRLFLLFICRRCVVAASLPAASLVRVFSRPHLQWRLQLKADVSLPLPLPLSFSLIAVVLVRARSAFSSCRHRRRLALFLYYQRERTAAALLLLRNCFKLCLSQPLPVPPPFLTPFDKHYTQDIAFAFYTRYLEGSMGIMTLCQLKGNVGNRQKKIAWQIALSIYILVQNLSVCLSLPLFVSLLYIFSLSLLLSSLYLLSVFTSSVCLSFPLYSAFLLSVFCPSFPLRLSLFCLTVCLTFCPYEHLYLRD